MMTKTRETTPRTPLRLSSTFQLGPEARRVLLAVKDEGMRQVLGSPLRAEGYEIVEAENEAELLGSLALSMLQGRWREPVSAIVCDARQDAEILDALMKLRRAGYSTPVVVIAAQGDRETAGFAKSIGAAALFTTPFHAIDLRTALREAIANRPADDDEPTKKIKAPPKR
jgi:DNA-binding NtrC family response regulator